MSVATILISASITVAGQGLGAGSGGTPQTILVGVADPITANPIASAIVVSSSALNAAIQAAVRTAGCSLTT